LFLFFAKVAAPRAIVQPDIIPNILIPFDNLIDNSVNSQFIHATVKNVHKNRIDFVRIIGNRETNIEETLFFDILVLALGSSYAHPFQSSEYDRNDQIQKLKSTSEMYKWPERILVVGGGRWC
jgi:hypothetical protein